jgi:hypothetical protein
LVALPVPLARRSPLLGFAFPFVNLALEDTLGSTLNVEEFAAGEPLGTAANPLLTSTDMAFYPSADFRSGDGAVQDPANIHSVDHLAITSSLPFTHKDRSTLPDPRLLDCSSSRPRRTSIPAGDDQMVHLAPILDGTMAQIPAICENQTLKKELEKQSKKIQEQKHLLSFQEDRIRDLIAEIQERKEKSEATVPIQAQTKTIKKLSDKVGESSTYSRGSSKRPKHSASSSRRAHHCTTCGTTGHNKKTCNKGAVSEEPQPANTRSKTKAKASLLSQQTM